MADHEVKWAPNYFHGVVPSTSALRTIQFTLLMGSFAFNQPKIYENVQIRIDV